MDFFPLCGHNERHTSSFRQAAENATLSTTASELRSPGPLYMLLSSIFNVWPQNPCSGKKKSRSTGRNSPKRRSRSARAGPTPLRYSNGAKSGFDNGSLLGQLVVFFHIRFVLFFVTELMSGRAAFEPQFRIVRIDFQCAAEIGDQDRALVSRAAGSHTTGGLGARGRDARLDRRR